MSLLEDVQIVITPNGYKAGTLYGVIPTPTEGVELINLSSFVSSTNWAINGSEIEASGTTALFKQPFTLGEGKTFKITIVVDSITSGNFEFWIGGYTEDTPTISVADTYTYYVASGGSESYMGFNPHSNLIATISSVSVKEVTSSDMDVTRATAATRVDEDGLIEDVLSNVPRIDYTGGGCPHILAEPQRTNLVTYSEDYGTGTYFSATNGSVIDNTTSISPSGENNATQITSTGAGKLQSAGKSLTQNTDYVLSFYAKNVDATEVKSRVLASGGSGGENLTSVSYISELSTTEWTRITHIFNTGTNTTFYVFLSNALNSGGTIQLWGAQLEEGSYATSYIPNFGTDAGVTRNQDVFTRDGMGSLINDSEGVLFAELSALADGEENRRISLSDGSNDNRVVIYFNTSNNLSVLVRVNNNTSFSYTHGTDIKEYLKVAVKWKVNDFALWVDGVEIDTDTSGNTFTANTLNMLSFADGNGSSLPFYGKVRQLQVYTSALTDYQLRELTT